MTRLGVFDWLDDDKDGFQDSPVRKFVRLRKWLVLSAISLTAADHGWLDYGGVSKTLFFPTLPLYVVTGALATAGGLFLFQSILLILQIYGDYEHSLKMRQFNGAQHEAQIVFNEHRQIADQYIAALEAAAKVSEGADAKIKQLNIEASSATRAPEAIRAGEQAVALAEERRRAKVEKKDVSVEPDDGRRQLGAAKLQLDQLHDAMNEANAFIKQAATYQAIMQNQTDQVTSFVSQLEISRRKGISRYTTFERILDLIRFFPAPLAMAAALAFHVYAIFFPQTSLAPLTTS